MAREQQGGGFIRRITNFFKGKKGKIAITEGSQGAMPKKKKAKVASTSGTTVGEYNKRGFDNVISEKTFGEHRQSRYGHGTKAKKRKNRTKLSQQTKKKHRKAVKNA